MPLIKKKVPKSRANPLKSDPSQTGALRRLFSQGMTRKINELQRRVTDLVVTQDVFGLKAPVNPLINYDPSQARVPAGSSRGGEFAGSGGVSSIAGVSHEGPQTLDEFKASNPVQFRALRNYAFDLHEEVNDYLRTGRMSSLEKPEKILNILEQIDSAMKSSKVSQAGIVYRTVPTSVASLLSVGEVHIDKGYMSTTKLKDMEKEGLDVSVRSGTQMILTLPAGHRAIDIGGRGIGFAKEAEILLDRNTSYRITKIEGGVVHAEVMSTTVHNVFGLKAPVNPLGNYDPSQPRVPAGSSHGGEWGSPSSVLGSESTKTSVPSDLLFSDRRKHLAKAFDREIEYIKSGQFGSSGKSLLDGTESVHLFGSFATKKENPSDIEIIVTVDKLTSAQQLWMDTQVFKQNQDIVKKRTDEVEIFFIQKDDPWSKSLLDYMKKKYGESANPISITINSRVLNVFCPTGPGGGVDPSCGKSKSSIPDPVALFTSSTEKIFGKTYRPSGEREVRFKSFPGDRFIKVALHVELETPTIAIHFGEHEKSDTFVGDKLQPGTLDMLHKLKEAIGVYRKEGFHISVTPSDARRKELYTKTLKRMGLEMYTSQGHEVWNVLTTNTRWQFSTTSQQVSQFLAWLSDQMRELFYPQDADSWWNEYIRAGWQQGANRAYNAWKTTPKTDLLNAFNQPVSIEKVKILAGRVLTELRGVTQAMATVMSRTLTDGLVRGDSPRDVGKALNLGVDKIGRVRANAIAQTETVRAHAEGQLDMLESVGMQNVGVAVEWHTSHLGKTRITGSKKKGTLSGGNPSPCAVCKPMEGVVFSIQEARGMIPRHPNCHCSFLPANVGEDGKGQVRGKKQVSAALDASIRAEIPPASKRTLAEQKSRISWAGASTEISVERPESVLNTFCPIGTDSVVENANPYHDKQGRFTTKDKAVNWHEPTYSPAEHVVRKTVTHYDPVVQSALQSAQMSQSGDEPKSLIDNFRSKMAKHNKELEGLRQDLVKDVVKLEKEVDRHKAKFDQAMLDGDKYFLKDKRKFKGAETRGHNAWDKLHDARMNLETAKAKVRSRLTEAINTKDPLPVKVYGLQEAHPEIAAKTKEAADWYGGMLDKKTAVGEWAHKVELRETNENRAFAQRGDTAWSTHSIHMNAHAGVDVHVHEIGHTLEFASPKINNLTRGFLLHRAEKDEAPKPYMLGERHEVGFKDEFDKVWGKDDAIYVGKHYNHGTTEVLAMGFQKLYSDPVALATKDPEYFKLLVGVLKGKFHE